uniref:DUF4283 domain-containing protein n=1 Tax=Quercus lobata TaxID=97700 RepID=A0A7N2LEP9_QUELO
MSKRKKTQGFVLAAKFYTCRSVNLEVVAKTFRPLWRTKYKFEVSDAGDNRLLFAFETVEDVEKVLLGEPWSFDRHIVVFQSYDMSTSIDKLEFDKVSFWIQIHNLPYSLLTTNVAINLGESIGKVYIPKDTTEMRGGNFMRVRVTINISEPLCRGRRVMFDENNDGWYNASKKNVVEVQGYGQNRKTDNREEGMNQGRWVMAGTGQNTLGTTEETNEPSVSKAVVEFEISDPKSVTDFEVQLKEIDEAIHGDGGVRNSNKADKVVNVESDTNLVVMETDSTGQRDKPHEETPLFQHAAHYVEKESPLFTPGWANFPLVSCLEKCRMKLEAWNKIEFGHVGNKIAELQKHLEWLERQPGTPNNVQDMKETQMKLNCWNEKQDAMWLQWLRINWYQAGDRNTGFFHAKALARKLKIHMEGLLDENDC